MCINKMKYSTKQLRIIRFGGVLIFIGTFIFLFIFTGNDRFLKRCVANGNSIKYCNDIYDDRNLAFQKEKKFIEKEFIEKKFDLESKNLLFRGEIYKNGNSYYSNGFKINSTLLSENDSYKKLLSDLSVPPGIIALQHSSIIRYNDNKNDNDIEESLYNKLLCLASKEKKNTTKKYTKKQQKRKTYKKRK